MAQEDGARSRFRIPVDKARWTCRPEDLPFRTTADLQISGNNIVGQTRAVGALDFGLTVSQPGYNIFVSGPVGTGRTTYTQSKITAMAAARRSEEHTSELQSRL